MRTVLRAAVWSGALLAAGAAHAQSRLPTVDQYTATTVAMRPAEIELRIDVREWSDAEARSAVVAALASDEDVASALAELPTVGYVWRSDSGVGYSVKYAHRAQTPQGERITFVTDKRLGAFDFEAWHADGREPSELVYSVIELNLRENGGDGTLSLAADVHLDDASGIVTLQAADGASRVLTDARLEPKPYWATGS